jgi:hypothetical protein
LAWVGPRRGGCGAEARAIPHLRVEPCFGSVSDLDVVWFLIETHDKGFPVFEKHFPT